MKLTLLSLAILLIIITTETIALFTIAGIEIDNATALLCYCASVLLVIISFVIKGKWL